MTTISKADQKEIERRRKLIEAQMEAEVDSLLSTRRNARRSLNDDLQPVKPNGLGRRTLNARAGYRTQVVWGRPAKLRFGALD